MAFHPSGVLRYCEWKTTESRLFETENFANVGLEIEPTRVPDQYNAVVRTTTKTNSLADFLFDAVKGLPFESSYFDLWNIANSGINFNSDYRWDTGRRREDGQLKIPVPLAGLLELELGTWWRSERWDVSSQIEPALLPFARFDYKATALRVHVKQIPHYRVELGGGFEYLNRAAKGDFPQLYTDSLNTGLIYRRSESSPCRPTTIRPGCNLEGFAARRSIIGNTQFRGGTAQLDNRVTLSKDTRTYLDWSVKGGTLAAAFCRSRTICSRTRFYSKYPLRGHTTDRTWAIRQRPDGKRFVLVNTDIERRLATLPFFNTVNIPYITVKWEVFFDGAKTWDRNHIFKPSKLLLDTGAGIRFETPTHSFNLDLRPRAS